MQRIIEYFKGLGIDVNTTATILLTIFTFSIGLFLTWMARQIKNIKEKKSYKKSLVLILEDFSKACDKQDKIVRNSLKTVGLKGNNIFEIRFVSIGTLDYLNKLDFNVFLRNFEPFLYKKHFSKAMSKLFELIAQVKIQNETVSDFMNQFSQKYARHETQYLENLNELRKIHDNLGSLLDGKKLHRDVGGDMEEDFFAGIKKIKEMYKKSNSKNYYAIQVSAFGKGTQVSVVFPLPKGWVSFEPNPNDDWSKLFKTEFPKEDFKAWMKKFNSTQKSFESMVVKHRQDLSSPM